MQEEFNRLGGSRPISRVELLIVFLAALVAFTAHLNLPGIEQRDELFYLGGGLELHESGQFALPCYHGELRLQKPPLQYWLVALSYRAFGVGVWQGRLPSALAALAVVALVYRLGLRLFGSPRSALYGAVALSSSYLLIRQSHQALTDSLLGLFVAVAIYGFVAAWQGAGRWAPRLAWAATGLAALQKGPIGFAIPAGVMLAWVLLDRAARERWRRLVSPSGVLLFLAIVLPWPLVVVHRLGWARAAGATGSELAFHLGDAPERWTGGVAHYLGAVLRGLFPWSLACLAYAFRRNRSSGERLLLIWGLGVAAALGLAMSLHRARYVVPLLPALALLAGHALARAEREPALGWVRRAFGWGLDAAFLLGALQSLSLALAGALLVFTAGSVIVGMAGLAFCAAAGVAARRMRLAERPGWVAASGALLVVAQVVLLFSWPAAGEGRPPYDLARRHLRGRPADATAVAVGLDKGALAWASLGAGFLLPGTPDTGGPIAWDRVPAAARLLLDDEAWIDMPIERRDRYRKVESASASAMTLRPLWFGEGLAAARRKWREERRTMVLLERAAAGGR